MNTNLEATGAFETPTANQRNSTCNATTRPQVRSALFKHDHEQAVDENGPYEEDPYNHDDAHDHDDEIKSQHSSSSSTHEASWMLNADLHKGKFARSRTSYRLVSGALGMAADVMHSSISSMFNALPVVKALTNLWRTQNGKTECPNIAAVVAELEKERSFIITAILDVASSTGHLAREKLLTAFDMLFDYSKPHCILIHAIMCYVWVMHPKSKLKIQLTSIAHDYALAADDNQVAMLLDACSKGHAMNFPIPEYLEGVTQLPGVIRLTLLPTMTNLEFEYVTDQWQRF